LSSVRPWAYDELRSDRFAASRAKRTERTGPQRRSTLEAGRSEVNPFDEGLGKNAANHVALSPLSFIARSAEVYPNKTALIHGALSQTWAQTYERCRRLASALRRIGIGEGDTVSILAPNTPAMYEAHFGVPMSGAVLNTINIRLDAATIGFILGHGGAKVLLVDREFAPVAAEAVRRCDKAPRVIDIDDPEYQRSGARVGDMEYEAFLATGDPQHRWELPRDEWQAIALNYTSGTTGNPKGVVIHHRGAYLNSFGNAVASVMGPDSVYLWTLPMFHCNGWSFTWTMALLGGTNVCLRRVETRPIFEAIRQHRVTHLCGAPIVLNMMINAPDAERALVDHPLEAMTGGAAPPASVIARMEEMGIAVTHLYGLTETYGPTVACAWHPEWNSLPLPERARIKSRVGVRKAIMEEVTVLDPDTLEPVPRDGETMGEVMMRGNVVMRGYLKNPGATQESFAGGWYHTGDLGVIHPDGYIQIKDRSKDIIISGGENISSIELEDVLYQHPSVLEAAVVARPDERWGETPCAFVALKPEAQVTEADIIAFCRERLASFKVPKAVVFGALPKTATGKVQKYVLRSRARGPDPAECRE
jgi:fatty-acyl-CoA synthase